MTNYSSGDHALTQALNNSYQKTNPTRFCYQVAKGWQQHSIPASKHINYVIATWSGPRRAGNEKLEADACYYLDRHLKALNLARDIDQISIMVPENPDEPESFTQYLNSLSDDYTVIRRPNIGQSYGSWVDCFLQYQDSFDYYIFVEDDYIPIQQNFDEILIKMFESSQNCGYLCSRVDKYPPTNYMGRPHAAISNGITSSLVLKKIIEKLGEIKYGKESTQGVSYAATPQLEFSWSFLDAGFWLYDYSPFYSSPYHHVGNLQHYGDSRLPALFYPAQHLPTKDLGSSIR